MWWIKSLMGSKNSTYLQELSDDSDDDSDFDYSLERRDKETTRGITDTLALAPTSPVQNSDIHKASNDLVTDFSNKEMNLTTDAAPHFLNPTLALRLEMTLDIEQNLENYEIISLVYLLYEDPNFALQELTLLLHGADKHLLHTWANLEDCHGKPWQKKLIEALCIIKNFQILRTLGYKKHDVIMHFLPHLPNAITSLNKMKKGIYLLCEKLNSKKVDIFLEIVKDHFQEKGMTFTEYDREYLELYFLDWEKLGYISMTDLSNIKRTLKVMEEETLLDILNKAFITSEERVEKKQEESIQGLSSFTSVEERRPIQRLQSTSTDTHRLTANFVGVSGDILSPPPSIGQDSDPDSKEDDADNHKYEIDPENPGVLLIVNQEEFYTEVDEKYLHLLPEDIKVNKLESRKGTEKDKMELENIFTRFGFKVIIVENLTHEDLIANIKNVVKSITIESSLFVCILSHGDKGVVYGSNSCEVKVNIIRDIMCRTNKENLVGKPKILILQSCQGKRCQTIDECSEDEEELGSYSVTTDGPSISKPSVPRTVDVLTFWATVPGFAAIRNKKKGSWFIQALCSKMTALGNKYHFADICTRINRDVSGKTWILDQEKNAMTPMVVSTLTKDFYLPPMRKDN